MSNLVRIRNSSGAWINICGCKIRKADNTWSDPVKNLDNVWYSGAWVEIDCTQYKTLLIDYIGDTTADLCFYCTTAGVTEQNEIVTSTTNGGPLMIPNDGRDPMYSAYLSSDKLSPGPPTRRFGLNIDYFAINYPSIDHFTWILRGRKTGASSVSMSYGLRDITQGFLQLGGTTGARIPSVSRGTTSPVSFTSAIASGADGTVGISIGSSIVQVDYVVSTNTFTLTHS